jgi:hypothetical protein
MAQLKRVSKTTLFGTRFGEYELELRNDDVHDKL